MGEHSLKGSVPSNSPFLGKVTKTKHLAKDWDFTNGAYTLAYLEILYISISGSVYPLGCAHSLFSQAKLGPWGQTTTFRERADIKYLALTAPAVTPWARTPLLCPWNGPWGFGKVPHTREQLQRAK